MKKLIFGIILFTFIVAGSMHMNELDGAEQNYETINYAIAFEN